MVVDVDQDTGERQPAVRALDAGELLQRRPSWISFQSAHVTRASDERVRIRRAEP